ncbi:MAG: trypsin-like peptidase domain-containing protein [Clostridia bacterium]|nr:trypsin-like peptidase domain-containing protein [Clostridia bacterium]
MMEEERRSGLRMAALVVTIAAAVGMTLRSGSGTGSRTVYAQGEYVETIQGAGSPFTEVADRVTPCVVGVSNRANSYSIISGTTQLIEQSTGSGVVITTQGHVVTNYHVVEGANDLQILWKGQYLSAELVGADEMTDLAVLRVTEDVALPAVRMGNPEEVRAGDWAIVIGNPLGMQLADTVTVGVISAVNRELDDTTIVKMIQTDAAINSGNSGGGMFNTNGELIGIPSLKFSASGRSGIASIEGIAMAIPMDVVQPVVSSIIQYGKVTRPKIGISVMTIRGSDELKRGEIPSGVLVSAITEGSPAEAAGIHSGDIITRVDGQRVTMHTDLMNVIAMKQAGEEVRLTVYRIPGLESLTIQDSIPEGEEIEVAVRLELPAQRT